jgi:hypothetical protein
MRLYFAVKLLPSVMKRRAREGGREPPWIESGAGVA